MVLHPVQPAFPSKKQRKQHLLDFVCPVDEGELAKTYADWMASDMTSRLRWGEGW